MPRKRIISPEFWSDEEIGHWSPITRLFYIALWTFADDCGRFRASSALLKAQIFPYDDPRSLKIKTRMLELGNKIEWYEVNGQKYGYIRNFLKYQRIDKPSPSQIPKAPTENSTNLPRIVEEDSRLSKVKLSKENIREATPAPSKTKFRDFVFLFPKEFESLKTELTEKVLNEYIDRLNDYIGSKGVKYKSHYHTIKAWFRKDPKPQAQTSVKQNEPDCLNWKPDPAQQAQVSELIKQTLENLG